MPSSAETYSNALLQCLEDQYNLLPAAVRPASYEKIAGMFFVVDIDPPFGRDKCCAGTGWVRVGDTYPTDGSLEPIESIKANACLPVSWAVSLDVGVARCYPGYGKVQAPTDADHRAARALDLLDLQTIEKAICCWAKTLRPKGTLYQVTGIAVNGPAGVCISRIANIIVQTGKCC